MNEKKLTDKEIVKSLECCANFSTQKDCDLCPIGVIKCFEQENLMPQLALDLIHRLQATIAEYEQKLDDGELLSKDYHDEQVFHYVDENAELRAKIEVLKTELQKECQEHLAFAELAKKADEQQKKEIERLTEVHDRTLKTVEELNAKNCGLEYTKVELQKQVDELKEERKNMQAEIIGLESQKEDLYFQNKNLQTYIDNHEPIWKRNTEQAVKDTAKEIIAAVKDCMRGFEDDDDGYLLKKGEFEFFMREIAKLKGVEVK